MRSFCLTFPAGVTHEGVACLLDLLAGEPRGTVLSPAPVTILETVLSPAGASWWVQVEGRRARRLQAASERTVPGISWEAVAQPGFTISEAVELRATSTERLLDLTHVEAVAGRVLGVAGELGAGESVLLQWQIGPTVVRSPIATTTSETGPWWVLPGWEQTARTSEQATAARRKQEQHVYSVVGRLAVSGATGQRAWQLLNAVAGGYQLLAAPGMRIGMRRTPSWWVRRQMLRGVWPEFGPQMRLTAAELAAVVAWPIGNPALPGVAYITSTRLRLPDAALVKDSGATARVVGEAAHPAQTDRVAVLRPEDGLRHLHVLGPSGVGKSTLLGNLILSDIAAGRGVVAIDPKGDLVDDVLARVRPEDSERVVVFDPSDSAPVGFNPLVGSDSVGIDGVMTVMRSIWAGSWGPRLGDALHAGLLTLAVQPGHSLAELPVLLTDVSFRRPLVSAAVAKDRLGLGTFWPWFDNLSDDARAQVLGPIMNKLRAFLLRADLRAVLGQAQPRFDLTDVFTKKAVVLVRLPKGEIGSEAAQLLGSLLVAHLWRLAQARSAVPANRRHPVFFYLDEFQEFLRLPVDLSDALVQARGLGVGLVLAHQHLGQLDKTVKAAVLANAASRVAFRLDHEDAGVIAKRSGKQLRPEDLSGLAAYEAYASLLVGGQATGFGSLRTRPLPAEVRDPAGLKQLNRERYGIDRTVTEDRLNALLETGTADGAQGPTGPIGGRRANPGGAS